VDQSEQLTADRDRLQAEITNLVQSIAVGVPADTIAPAIKEREMENRAGSTSSSVAPRRVPPNMARGKGGRWNSGPKQWKKELRAEPAVARFDVAASSWDADVVG